MERDGPMRAWRALLFRYDKAGNPLPKAEGFVVDCGSGTEPVVTTLIQALPEGVWRALHEYVLIDSGGAVARRCEVTTWSIDVDLGASVFAVVDGALRNLCVTVVCSDPVRIRRTEEVVADGLQEVSVNDLATMTFLSHALDRNLLRMADDAAQRGRAADARLAAIPGARKDYAISEQFRQAQHVLCHRVRAYGRQIDCALLTALARFGELHCAIRDSTACTESTSGAATAALNHFIMACRLAAFDRTLEREDTGATPEKSAGVLGLLLPEIDTTLHELKRSLGELQRELLQEAEHQEWVDANLNAAAFHAAAVQVSRSLTYLEPRIQEERTSLSNTLESRR